MNHQAPLPLDVHLDPQFGLVEFVRRLRRDQLSVLVPELYWRPLIRQRFLFLTSFFVNRPDFIEQILLTNQPNYQKSHFTRRLLGPMLGNGLFTSEGELWRRQRRIAAPAFHQRRIAGFVDTMAASTRGLLERWQGRREAFDVHEDMMALTLDIIARTMFSADFRSEIPDLRRLIDTVLEHAKPSVLDLFGLPEWLPRRYPRAFHRAIAELDRLVAGVLAPRRADGEDRSDLLSMLLAARDSETGEGMTDRQLRDEIMTIFLAGHETTANALTWLWYLLAGNPEAEAKLHAEIDAVLAGRPPTYADLGRLRYTRMCFEEALRLYPPAHTISRAALADDVLGGVRVPAGAVITIIPYVTHRNPTLWDEPERFIPERFEPEAVAARHRFAYLPFGGGPRICIGNNFAMVEAQIIVAGIAQRYRLRLVPGHDPAPIGLLTLRAKNGVKVTLEPRTLPDQGIAKGFIRPTSPSLSAPEGGEERTRATGR